MIAGTHKVQLSAAGLASGVYLYQFKADDFVLSNKMVYSK
jgi:hypothetical protein